MEERAGIEAGITCFKATLCSKYSLNVLNSISRSGSGKLVSGEKIGSIW